MKYYTSLRPYVSKRVEQIESADILIGIPSYNSERTIGHVIEMVSEGLHRHYKDLRSVVMLADGGSTDDTRDVIDNTSIGPWQEKLVTIYRGPAGKGTALRSIFEVATRLSVKACMVVDSDLRSITGDWVKHLLDPVIEKDYDFVAPIYCRYKYDGTITNNVVYYLTRALYGKRIRQPIGGDFAFSKRCASFYMNQDVWETDIAKFGVDIWITTSAIVNNFKICQSHLGVKIHDAKDPAVHLAPMYRQVITTLFALMEEYENFWKEIKSSEPTEVFGEDPGIEPEPVAVDLKMLVRKFKFGYKYFGVLWRKIFSEDVFRTIRRASRQRSENLYISPDDWAKILYEIAATFHKWKHNRYKLVELSTPLYYGKVASFINHSRDMNSAEAERLVERNALVFEHLKPFLLELWDKPLENNHELDPELEDL
ncbi:MAG: glycosyl transferase family 2 [candidate division Zixibacteria bacterium 4484_95]|nr:MAG: glycosyl transferase family 2 [candidate division Zixibacteria bacterium 4484_95]